MARAGAEKSSFSITCSRLSQFLKEKGSLHDLPLGLSTTRESIEVEHETPRTMNLLPGLGSSGDDAAGDAPRAAPMTIFYGGKVTVFENFPADKAEELLAMVCRGSGNAGAPPRDAAVPAPACAAAAPPPQKPALPLASDLPIARRVSLNRFLEKRKDRINSKAPYASPDAVPASPAPAPKRKAEAEQPWLALAPAKLERTL